MKLEEIQNFKIDSNKDFLLPLDLMKATLFFKVDMHNSQEQYL